MGKVDSSHFSQKIRIEKKKSKQSNDPSPEKIGFFFLFVFGDVTFMTFLRIVNGSGCTWNEEGRKSKSGLVHYEIDERS